MKIPTEKKKIQKLEYLKNKNSYSDEKRFFFDNYLRAFIWQRQALTLGSTKNIQFDSQIYTIRTHLQYGL